VKEGTARHPFSGLTLGEYDRIKALTVVVFQRDRTASSLGEAGESEPDFERPLAHLLW
jgi:hypothetical protein